VSRNSQAFRQDVAHPAYENCPVGRCVSAYENCPTVCCTLFMKNLELRETRQPCGLLKNY